MVLSLIVFIILFPLLFCCCGHSYTPSCSKKSELRLFRPRAFREFPIEFDVIVKCFFGLLAMTLRPWFREVRSPWITISVNSPTGFLSWLPVLESQNVPSLESERETLKPRRRRHRFLNVKGIMNKCNNGNVSGVPKDKHSYCSSIFFFCLFSILALYFW